MAIDMHTLMYYSIFSMAVYGSIIYLLDFDNGQLPNDFLKMTSILHMFYSFGILVLSIDVILNIKRIIVDDRIGIFQAICFLHSISIDNIIFLNIIWNWSEIKSFSSVMIFCIYHVTYMIGSITSFVKTYRNS